MGEIIPICEDSSSRRAYTEDKSFVPPIPATYVPKNRMHYIRMGITANKKTGNAIKRDRSCRIICEAARQLMPEPLGECDLIFVAWMKTPFVKSTDTFCDMREHLSQSGILK